MRTLCRIILAAVFCALAAITACGAAKRDGKSKNGEADLRNEWVREVKKLESEPVASDFAKWRGLDGVMGNMHLNRFTPGDLRGRFVIVIELDDTKVEEQINATLPVRGAGIDFMPGISFDWNFESIDRDVLVVYNLHNLSEKDLEEKVLKSDAAKRLVSFDYFSNVTFDGAPNSEQERPYVYVMGPEGKEPLYKGKMDKSQTPKAVRDAIKKAKAALPSWRPYYGYVDNVNYSKGFESAINSGKPLTQVIALLKKGILSKDNEVATESQRLYDALGRTKGDMIYQIRKKVWYGAPVAALYDIEELSSRFPALKNVLATYRDKISTAHPTARSIYKHYALYRKYADPAFRPKSDAAAKKIALELSTAKQSVAKFANDKDVAIQNLALSLPQHIDELIAELPGKVIRN
jgi:hypothetical protein